MKISIKKKQDGIYCCAYGCKNNPIPKKGMLCHRHYMIKFKDVNRMMYRYNQFKINAKKRNIEFTITKNQFRKFCQMTGYLIKKGVCGYRATIDRRCNVHGYHYWNIQLLSMRKNIKKYQNKDRQVAEYCPF